MNPIPHPRRSFIQSMLAASAAPLFLPSRVWGASVGPNDTIRLGLIGCGIQGRGLMGGFLKLPNARVVAVCDVDTTRREFSKQTVEEFYSKQSGSEFKGCAVYADFRELLGRSDIDAVVIATPDHWHAIIAIAASVAGKDIYCEKPLTNTVFEATSLVSAIRKHGRVFQTGSMQRSMREFRIACELVRNGVIGKIAKVDAGFGGPAKACDLPAEEMENGLDWDRWLGPAPMREYNSVLSPRGVNKHFPMWRMYREYGGGMITDWGAHHLDITHWGLDMDRSGPTEIHPSENWNQAQEGAQLVYPGGVQVSHVSVNGVTFYGADGQVYVNRGKIKVTLKDKVEAAFMAKEDKPALSEQLDTLEKTLLSNARVRLYASSDHKADFLNAMVTRKQPIADVETGARTVIGCHLLGFAYYYGQKFKWNAANNRFDGGSGDPRWLHREYRGAWSLKA